MPKVTINTLSNLDSPSAVAQLNVNFTNIQSVIETILSRDGTSPNEMDSDLDMNNRRIINLPVPTSPLEAARHGDLQTYVDDAEAAQLAAETAQSAAETAETNAETALGTFESVYFGGLDSDPTEDLDGNALDETNEGAVYANTQTNELRHWVSQTVLVNTDEVLVGSDGVFVWYWQPVPMNYVLSAADVDLQNDVFVSDDAVLVNTDEVYVAQIANGEFLEWNSGLSKFRTTRLPNYDFGFFVQGNISNNERLFTMVAARAFALKASLETDTQVYAITAPGDGNLSLSVRKNGSEFATIDIPDSTNAGSLDVDTDTEFAIGDRLEVFSPASADTVVQDISVTMVAERTV